MKIRTQLLLLLFGALFATTVLVSFVQVVTAYVQTRQDLEARVGNEADQISRQVELWFETIWQVGQFIVRQPFVHNASAAELQRLLGSFGNIIEGFDNLMVLDVDGRVTHVYPGNLAAIGVSYAEQPYFQAAVADKLPQISSAAESAVTGKRIVVIAQPIVDQQGKVQGVLLQNIKLDFLQNMVAGGEGNFSSAAALFTGDGQLLAVRATTPSRGEVVPAMILEAFRKDRRDTLNYVAETGQDRLGAVNRVRLPGWGVVVSLDEREIWRVFQLSIRNGLIAFLLIFTLLSIAAFTIFRRLFRSVTAVTERIERMAQGNWSRAGIDDALLQTAPQEFRQLGLTFNHMAEVIRMHIEILNEINAALEIKVEERTQELTAMNEELMAVNQQLQAMNEEFVRANQALAAEISERERVQTELAGTNQELNQSLQEVTRMQEELLQREKMAALGNLVAGIAHEINTPVGVSVTAVSLLDEEAKRLGHLLQEGTIRRSDLEEFISVQRESLDIISKNLKKASDLIRSFKKVAVDQVTEEKRAFLFKNYLEDVLLSLRPVLKKTRHQVQIECDEELVLDSYPGIISQIITNLIMNSLLHAYKEGDAGTMTIRATRQADRTGSGEILELVFCDDGQGMTPEVKKQVFEPFFTTKRGRGGTGLGMHIVYNLVVVKLAGSIECWSEAGLGTRFFIRLPLKESLPAGATAEGRS